MVRTLLGVLLCVFAFTNGAFSAPPDTSTARLDKIVRTYVEGKKFMGSVLVARDETILLEKGYGFANLELQVPNGPSTRFRIGSLTKQFTAAAVLLLEERRKLRLDDIVEKFYPNAPAPWRRVTVAQLLSHTSGIPNYTNGEDFPFFSSRKATPEDIFRRVRDMPLDFPPGTAYRYSNTGYVLLGVAIEMAGGTSYANFLRQELFAPLKMFDTGYDYNASILPERAAGYTAVAGVFANAAYIDMSTPFAAGGLYSTVQDLYRWERALFGASLLSAESFRKMTTPVREGYGYGLQTMREGERTFIGHGGGISGFNAALGYWPEDHIVIAVLSNFEGAGAGEIVESLSAAVHGDVAP